MKSVSATVAVTQNRAELSSPCPTIRRRALKASLPDLRRLLSSPNLCCVPATRDQPSSEGRVVGSELTGMLCCGDSFACGGGGYAGLPLRVLLLLPCGGANARAAAARKGTWANWARKLEKENGLSGL
jgi:hypothetical protein